MIITCFNCETKFNLPENKIPDGGAKVKCSKCGNIFKVTPPAQEPEDEVEALLEEKKVPEEQVPPPPTPAPEPVATPKSAPEPENDFPDLPDDGTSAGSDDDFEDDLFGSDENESGSDADIGADLFDEDESGSAERVEEDQDFNIDDELLGDDEDSEESVVERPTEEYIAEEDENFEEEQSFLEDDADDSGEEEIEDDGFSLDDKGITSFDLDEESPSEKRPVKKKSRGLIITIVILFLFAGGVGGAWYFKLWEILPFDIPFITSNDSGNIDSNESPSKRFSKFSFKSLRQFYVNNDRAGQLFIIEGKVVNSFEQAKELIEVEAQLFDGKGQVLDSKRLLCGNTLSLFQLEVQSREEIEAALASKVGVLSNNTLLKTGMSTPFMVVFFKPSPAVREYVINVVEAKNPPK